MTAWACASLWMSRGRWCEHIAQKEGRVKLTDSSLDVLSPKRTQLAPKWWGWEMKSFPPLNCSFSSNPNSCQGEGSRLHCLTMYWEQNVFLCSVSCSIYFSQDYALCPCRHSGSTYHFISDHMETLVIPELFFICFWRIRSLNLIINVSL